MKDINRWNKSSFLTDVSPLWGEGDDFFSHKKLSAKMGAKLASRESE